MKLYNLIIRVYVGFYSQIIPFFSSKIQGFPWSWIIRDLRVETWRHYVGGGGFYQIVARPISQTPFGGSGMIKTISGSAIKQGRQEKTWKGFFCVDIRYHNKIETQHFHIEKYTSFFLFSGFDTTLQHKWCDLVLLLGPMTKGDILL